MKILLVDISIYGHHKVYIETLINKHNDYVCIVPEKINTLPYNQYIHNYKGVNNLYQYISWLRFINKIAHEEKVDVIHFLYSDCIYRFAGLGFNIIKNKFVIVATQHHMRESKMRWILMKKFSKKLDAIIVHTEFIKSSILNKSIKNVYYIDYPDTQDIVIYDSKESKRYWGLPENKPILLAIGGTRYDKGLDILLRALKNIDQPFHLLIAGTEDAITKNSIMEFIESYKQNVTVCLKHLSDEEFSKAISASDCIVLPYRKIFNGASGPMTAGVINEKYIIACNHGSIGMITEKYDLGYSFESENIESLSVVLSKYLSNPQKNITLKYLEYKKRVNPDVFRQKNMEVYNNCMSKLDRTNLL